MKRLGLLLVLVLAMGCASSALDDAVRAEATYDYIHARYERDCKTGSKDCSGSRCPAFCEDRLTLKFEMDAANITVQKLGVKRLPAVQRKALRRAEKRAASHVD